MNYMKSINFRPFKTRAWLKASIVDKRDNSVTLCFVKGLQTIDVIADIESVLEQVSRTVNKH